MAALSIEDRFGINDLFVRYTCALDAGDADTRSSTASPKTERW